jgi:AraC-like DNA-binding protein
MNEVLKKYPVRHPLLKRYIKFFWEINADFMQLNHNIIPVRNINLKFNLSETPHYLRIKNESHLLESVYFSGLQDRFLNARISMRGNVHVMGICFFPEGFYPFLKIPVAECKNQVLGAGEAGMISIKAIHEKLSEVHDITSRLRTLERELLSILDENFQIPENVHQLFISHTQIDSCVSLTEFCRQNNTGMRKLERMFNKYVGLSAKTYAMLYRFEDSINQLFYSDYSKLSDIAYGNDYFDQMHYIRDFKRFAGDTPSNFIRQNNSMLQIR